MPLTVKINGRSYIEYALSCPDCNAPMFLVPYGNKVLYKCSKAKETFCGGTHGSKPDGSPLGIPADKLIRQKRRELHRIFDLLWNQPDSIMTRTNAYAWLQGIMNMNSTQAHISCFDGNQCDFIMQHLRSEFGLEAEPSPGEGRDGFFELSL